MRKIVRVVGVFVVLFLIVVGILFGISRFQKRGAGISIDTTPASSVFINDEQVGRTPYQAVFEPGEVVVKLIPDSFEKPLAPYETKVNLTSDVQTVIRREFGETEELSGGAIISFEKIGGREVGISVISIPDAAEVSLDGQVKGFTPFKTNSIGKGEHRLLLTAPNFGERSFNVVTVEGYKLTAVFKLIPSEVLPAKTEELPVVEEPVKKEEVLILDTGTGFLRVRATPTTSGAEIGRVEPGKKYILIEKDEKTGWFKIEYVTGKEGWVTNQFVKITESTLSTPIASPTPKSSPTPTLKPTTKPSPTPR